MRNFHSIIYLNRYALMVVLPRQLRSRQFLRHSHRFLCESFSSEELIILLTQHQRRAARAVHAVHVLAARHEVGYCVHVSPHRRHVQGEARVPVPRVQPRAPAGCRG